jgi:nucleoside-diphosphate-sugar epimerase
MATIALTGGTGFIGQRLIPYLIAQGHSIKALARQPQQSVDALCWIRGDLTNAAALQLLCAGTDAVIHLAGTIKGRTRADFISGNVDGTAEMLRAAHHAGVKRFLHISSLAAREPQLSHYCSSKAEAEVLVKASGLSWTIVRPPGVYGPGDRETLALFKAAQTRLMPFPAGHQRMSWIYVGDLCAAMAAALEATTVNHILEVDDGSGGHSHQDFARAIAHTVQRKPLFIPIHETMLITIAYINWIRSNIFGTPIMLSRGKVREVFHEDWVVRGVKLQDLTQWKPELSLSEGLFRTVEWYRRRGWMKR